MMLGIDLSVLLSFANIAALVWHARWSAESAKGTSPETHLPLH